MLKNRIKKFGQTGLTDTARFGPKIKDHSDKGRDPVDDEEEELLKKTGE